MECPATSLTFRRDWTGPSKPRTSFRTARKYLPLTTGCLRRYLGLDVELIDALEREMTPEQASPSEQKSPVTGQPADVAR